MKKALQIILMGIGILALAGIMVFAGMFFGRANIFQTWAGPVNMMSYSANPSGRNSNAYGPGMMGSSRGYASGMMGGVGYNSANLTPLTTEQAYQAAETYLGNLNNPDLQISEVMVFNNNAYIVIKEASTGLGAFELLVDSGTQVAYPEHGPNMMWNVKYSGLNHQYMMGARGGMLGGMMGGMMGANAWSSTTPADVSANLTVTPEKAIEIAQAYLDANIAGATAADDPIQFYGYYSLDFEKDGAVVGMLSVNGFSGQVFLHTWHGTFIEESMY